MQIRVDYEQVHQSASMIKQKAAQYDETIQKIYSRMYQMTIKPLSISLNSLNLN